MNVCCLHVFKCRNNKITIDYLAMLNDKDDEESNSIAKQLDNCR